MSDALVRFARVAKAELARVADALDVRAINDAVALIRKSEAEGGRVHVTGVGKPEHLAHYTASLLSSTGTPATFLHATESTHGSIGQTRADDVVIAISNGGRTRELLDAVSALRDFGARLIAVTGDPESPLARACDLTLLARVHEEGGPLDLAPRASVLAQTYVLCALSVALQDDAGLTRRDYNRRHPAGALGAKSGADE